jgi:hypothetical protein
VQSRGTSRFSIKAVFGELGVLQLCRMQVEPRRESAVKPVGKLDAGSPQARFDERGRETGDARRQCSRPSSTLQNCPP